MRRWFTAFLAGCAGLASAAEYHVAIDGNDGQRGTANAPLRTIQRAANLAQPGDTITVHAGVYRERIAPPRGGASDAQRIVYRAAPGEQVVIKGSEVVKGWKRITNDTWSVTLPDTFFGSFNPYRDVIRGDWFGANGRIHHTGAVYLNGHWLTEAAALPPVLAPAGAAPLWYTDGGGAAGQYLLNVAWLAVAGSTNRLAATRFAAQRGVQGAACSEGGDCIGWIEDGDWVRYDGVRFGAQADRVEFRAASPGAGGRIELRQGSPQGELLGVCEVAGTGDWQKWQSFTAQIKPTSGVGSLCLVFHPHGTNADAVTIWAQFKGVDPNAAGVEINMRQTVFYPDKPFVNYLTVQGFTLEQAATPWAPPTAEQMGLIGTHWSKGWIIASNTVRYSRCSGIALGKYGDAWDNRAESAEGYVGTINRALTNGWNRATIGRHVVRGNHISHCEQTGVVGSMGCAFSTVTENDIHDIHVLRLFGGAEMAGIKFHGAIDVEISRNHIYRCGSFGVWLDWMAQGAHVTGNLFHDNAPHDLFVEVDHGPFLVDHNLFLSQTFLLTVSQGGAFAHNLIAGGTQMHRFDGRLTPFHPAHSTAVAGLHDNPCGDFRFYNNLVVARGNLSPWNGSTLPVRMDGNVFTKGAQASTNEAAPLLLPNFDPALKLVEKDGAWSLELATDAAWATGRTRPLVTTALLGKAQIPGLPFEQADGTPYRLDTDYFGKPRNAANPFPGPFELPEGGQRTLTVWPVAGPRPAPRDASGK